MDKTIGVLGGGQLGRMLVEAANLLEIKVNFVDAGLSSAKQVSNHAYHIDGSFKDAEAVKKLAANSDVVTIEIEHVNTQILEEIANSGSDVQPSWRTIRTIQDKYLQKQHLAAHDLETAESLSLASASMADLEKAATALGLPLMLKSRREAYDGKGNFPVKSKDDFKPALGALGANKDLYAEKWADFRMELAVMVVKTKDQVFSFPTVETVHENSICKLTYAPARGVSKQVNEAAQALARKAVAAFGEGKGVFGVEMFLLPNDKLLINEIAPRPHNSGHYTIEACPVSQFEAHLRAILDLPLRAEDLQLREPSIMLNILGGDEPDSHRKFAAEALKHRRTKIHLYGKGHARKGRKMGHITVCAPSMSEAEAIVQPLIDYVDEGNGKTVISSQPKKQPLVAVVMGSDSDLPVLKPGLAILDKFGIEYECRVTSAHRTPRWMAQYASSAAMHSFKVIIAAAGGAAHLPGMTAAYTPLPVIGVPVKPSIGDGIDSLLSICNMPKGVPVATVGVNNSINAALLAARILGSADMAVRDRVQQYMADSEEEVLKKDAKLYEVGHDKY
ncbi:phosphoribosylaminoimidazole carboxylase [Teratosphaeria nubilosa]|uniref:Phosphoribosylaminoimidazole carboxylase n=1 Tax=Teratosphaeria nubilosa TaxID=161662 RepID=A0A6G1LK71_9PEZI|nr:phosphoribosylaminoimidazole carboxylase [Teratosphaeria nubilosa]